MKIEIRPLSEIKPYPNNPRLNDSAVDVVAASLKEFGFRQPIVVDSDGVIICGHTRFKAAQKLGLDKVPVHVATDLTPDQVRAYRIADNKTAEHSEWNFDLLPIEINELRAANFDVNLLGFDLDELASILGTEVQDGDCDPDDVPLPPDVAVTQPGDLWILGNHRLLCGDSSCPDQLDRLVCGVQIHMVNSDPPYGVAVEPRSKSPIAAGLSSFPGSAQSSDPNHLPRNKLRARDRPIANDAVTGEDFDTLLDQWFGNVSRVLLPGRGFYFWGGYANLENYPRALKRNDLYFSQAIVWDKQHPVINRKDFMGSFELCYYGWKLGAGHSFFGPNNATDLWHVKKVNPQSMIHLTEKPTELAVRAMQYSSRVGENVLDLFGGSGSTLIAAEQTNRKAFLMELDQLYCDVIVDRYQRFSGKPAVLERTGTSPIPMQRAGAA